MSSTEGMRAYNFFPKIEESTRGDTIKVRGERFNRNLRSNAFTQRVVLIWSRLPEEVVETSTMATFNRHLNMKG